MQVPKALLARWVRRDHKASKVRKVCQANRDCRGCKERWVTLALKAYRALREKKATPVTMVCRRY